MFTTFLFFLSQDFNKKCGPKLDKIPNLFLNCNLIIK